MLFTVKAASLASCLLLSLFFLPFIPKEQRQQNIAITSPQCPDLIVLNALAFDQTPTLLMGFAEASAAPSAECS